MCSSLCNSFPLFRSDWAFFNRFVQGKYERQTKDAAIGSKPEQIRLFAYGITEMERGLGPYTLPILGW